MGVPHELGHTITARTLQSLRGYFVGVTAVAVFNAVVIGLGALVLGVPELGRDRADQLRRRLHPLPRRVVGRGVHRPDRARVGGPETALTMAVIVLLANGVLQQMIQPIAYGAALGIHPLAVLIVTIAGGSLFGAIGLILAAPLTSAVVKISADLARARASRNRGTPTRNPRRRPRSVRGARARRT